MAIAPVLPKLIGQRVKRREDPRLIQGGATYVDDVEIAGLQYIVFKRSDVAHGRITSIDVSAARAMEGVEAVYTGADIQQFLKPLPVGPFTSPPQPAVASDTVRFAGEPVAVSKLDDVTLGSRLDGQREEQEADGKNARLPDYSHLSTLRRTDQRGCGAETVCPRIQWR